jgi:hypothetical protein
MISAVVRFVLVMTSFAAAGAAAVVLHLQLEQPAHLPPIRQPATAPVRHATLPDSVLRIAIGSGPFRLRRTPAQVRYDPLKAAVPPVPANPGPPKPALTLRGIAWSAANPAAVIEGLPGVEGGRSVVPGDTMGRLTVKRITRTGVVVSGLDTVWSLNVKEVTP